MTFLTEVGRDQSLFIRHTGNINRRESTCDHKLKDWLLLFPSPDNNHPLCITRGQQTLITVETDPQDGCTVSLQFIYNGLCGPFHIKEINAHIFTASHCRRKQKKAQQVISPDTRVSRLGKKEEGSIKKRVQKILLLLVLHQSLFISSTTVSPPLTNRNFGLCISKLLQSPCQANSWCRYSKLTQYWLYLQSVLIKVGTPTNSGESVL